MKRINLLLKASLILIICSVAIGAQENSKSKSFKLIKGGSLRVELNAGNISILTWDKDEVLMKVTGVTEEGFKNVDTYVAGNSLSIKYDNYEDSDEDVKFEFTVPVSFNADLKTMAGDIKLQNNISGNIEVDTYGGDIRTLNIKGSLRLETKGGDVKIGDISGDCNVNSYGGDITAGVLSGKNIKINTNGGEIRIAKSTSGVNLKTYGGDISVGDLGGGSDLTTHGGNISTGFISGSIKLETYGGDLEVKGAKGKVRGKTSGGNITLMNIDGSVDVKTMSGSVNVELNPSPNSESRISTNAGSVELTLPSSAKTTIDARIYVQGWWKEAKETYKIDSDFETTTEDLDAEDKTIKSSYVVNGGGSVIYLKTINDSITIRKSK